MHEENPQHCPVCRENSGLVSLLTVRMSLRDWPLLLICAGVIMCAADLLAISLEALVFFEFLALTPLCFSLRRKHSCRNCGVEFQAEEQQG